MFKKNSIEFFIGLDYYLYYSYSSYTTISSQLYVLLECSMITWPCHVIWLPKFPCYLYLNPFVQLSTQMYGILFPFWSSYNNFPESISVSVAGQMTNWGLKVGFCQEPIFIEESLFLLQDRWLTEGSEWVLSRTYLYSRLDPRHKGEGLSLKLLRAG